MSINTQGNLKYMGNISEDKTTILSKFNLINLDQKLYKCDKIKISYIRKDDIN